MGRLESVVLFAVPALATLLISSSDPLWIWAFEVTILLLTARVTLLAPEQGMAWQVFLPLAAIGLWGFAQLTLGATVYRYATLDASLRLAAYVAMAFWATAALQNRRHLETWLTWFCWFAVVLALLSVLSYSTSPGKILWIFPAIYPDNWGPFASRNNFAQFLELSFPVAVYQFTRPHAREGEGGWLSGIPPAVLFACGIASASRAGAAILVLEALCLIALLRPKLTAVVSVVLLTAASILLIDPITLAGRFHDPDPLSVRREIFHSMWEMIQGRPWSGYGLGTFPQVYPEFAVFDPGTKVDHAHSDWLEWASEGGIFFAAAWVFLVIFIAPAALRSIWGVGILAVFIHASVDYPFAKLGVAAWVFALIGALQAHQGSFTKEQRSGRKRRSLVKLKTVQSVVAALVSLNLSIVTAAPQSIGVAVTRGNFRVDDANVSGNATLVEGTTVETRAAASSLQLTGGARIALAADSKGQVFGDHIVLEKGGGQMEQLLGYRVEARGLILESQTGVAKAQVALAGPHMVQMAALTGSFRVLNVKGMVVANLTPGSALEFNPQAASQGEPWKLSGCLRSAAGHFTLTDDTTSVTVEAAGASLDREAGNRVEILGAMDPAATPVSGASQLIRVSQIKRVAKGCPVNKGAAAAGAGGAAAGAGATVAGISTTTIAVVGGVAAAATIGGLAAANKLPGQSSASAGSTSR
jgi:O-antigen ligase